MSDDTQQQDGSVITDAESEARKLADEAEAAAKAAEAEVVKVEDEAKAEVEKLVHAVDPGYNNAVPLDSTGFRVHVGGPESV